MHVSNFQMIFVCGVWKNYLIHNVFLMMERLNDLGARANRHIRGLINIERTRQHMGVILIDIEV
jgi:hypothetical protein